MKKLSLLVSILFFGLIATAHVNHGKSELNLKLWNNSYFKVRIDNHSYGKTTSLQLGNLSPGLHRVKITKHKKGHHHSGFVQVLYNGTIKIPKNSKVLAMVTPHRGLKLKVVKKQHGHHNPHGGNHPCNHYGECNSSCDDDGSGYGNGGYGHDDYGNGGYNYEMNQVSFNQLLQTVSNETFDSDRLDVIKIALMYNDLNTSQVAILMSQFTFDSDKLTFAKLAYPKTVDKENYYLVSNGFTFSRSKNKLLNYIENYHS